MCEISPVPLFKANILPQHSPCSSVWTSLKLLHSTVLFDKFMSGQLHRLCPIVYFLLQKKPNSRLGNLRLKTVTLLLAAISGCPVRSLCFPLVLPYSAEDLGTENSEPLYTAPPEIKAWGESSADVEIGREEKRTTEKETSGGVFQRSIWPQQGAESRPPPSTRNWCGCIMTVCHSLTRRTPTQTHASVAAPTDFRRSHGQDGLQSKAVELWVSAHGCLLSLWLAQFCLSASTCFNLTP